MIRPKDKYNKGRAAAVAVMSALSRAHAGMHHDAHEAARSAYHLAQAHRDDLASHEDHAAIAHFNEHIDPMFNELERVMASSLKNAKPISAPEVKQKRLKKSDEAQDAKVNKNPGRDPRYAYKPFHALSTEQQTVALGAFRHSSESMDNYHYATDPKTGQIVHGQRWLANAPQANQHKSKISEPKTPMPQHAVGAGVTIQSVGHKHHGAYGEVQRPNPQMPGKIRVKVKNKETNRFEDTYVAPHEVGLKLKKSESGNVVLISKSKAALKRFNTQKGK